MCRYNVISFACGHDLLEHTTECKTRVSAGPFKHFPQCEKTEPLRLDSRICSNCMAKHQEAREAARAVHARHNVLPRWKRRILGPLSKILEDQLEAPAVVPVPVSRKTPPFPLHGTGIRAGPFLLRPKGPYRQKIPARGKATSTLDPKAIPPPIPEGEEPKSDSGRSLNSKRSWSTGDDLSWQSMPLQLERTVHHAQPVSDLDVLPSQLHPLRQNPPEKTLHHSRAQVPPPLPPRYELWEPQRSGRNVQRPHPHPNMANIHRLSRAEQQDAELFFSQYDPKAPAALEAGSQAAKETRGVPTILRVGRPRADSTYLSPTVGQIPAYYNTASDQKFSNRHVKLSTRDEATWESFILTHPTTPEMAASAGDHPPSLPQLTKLPALSLKEEIHLSSRISHPGIHDSYISSPRPPEELSASPASGKKRAKGGKTGNGKLQKKSWQVPRHRGGRPFSPVPECFWDEIVRKACVSLKSLSLKSNASDS